MSLSSLSKLVVLELRLLLLLLALALPSPPFSSSSRELMMMLLLPDPNRGAPLTNRDATVVYRTPCSRAWKAPGVSRSHQVRIPLVWSGMEEPGGGGL